MSAPDTTLPTLPEPKRVSGRAFVIFFVAFVIVGLISSGWMYLTMRPVTMDARAKMMPLSGTVRLSCQQSGQMTVVDRMHATCSKAGKLEVSLPNPGVGVRSMTYVLLSGNPQEAPVAGQFAPNGSAQIDLQSTLPEPHVAVFVYADQPVALDPLLAALKAAPAGDMYRQITAIEKYGNTLMHADPKAMHEIRTARVELNIVSG
jgi:hypothetical protein